MRSRSTFILAPLLLALACGGPAAQSQATPVATVRPADTTARPSPRAEGLTLRVAEGSEVTVAVREQLAELPAPNDAILITKDVTGEVTLKDDGTFAEGSAIEVDLDTLESDSRTRDSYIKRTTLRTSQFPVARFVPTRADGLTLPVPDGPFSFTLRGNMTISGVTKEVAWEVTGERTGDRIVAEATNVPAWKFADFGLAIPRVFSVISIVDEIRLNVKLQGDLTEVRLR